MDTDISTFSVLGAREYDLSDRHDFRNALGIPVTLVILVALNLCLRYGSAQCATMQDLFDLYHFAGCK